MRPSEKKKAAECGPRRIENLGFLRTDRPPHEGATARLRAAYLAAGVHRHILLGCQTIILSLACELDRRENFWNVVASLPGQQLFIVEFPEIRVAVPYNRSHDSGLAGVICGHGQRPVAEYCVQI